MTNGKHLGLNSFYAQTVADALGLITFINILIGGQYSLTGTHLITVRVTAFLVASGVTVTRADCHLGLVGRIISCTVIRCVPVKKC